MVDLRLLAQVYDYECSEDFKIYANIKLLIFHTKVPELF